MHRKCKSELCTAYGIVQITLIRYVAVGENLIQINCSVVFQENLFFSEPSVVSFPLYSGVVRIF